MPHSTSITGLSLRSSDLLSDYDWIWHTGRMEIMIMMLRCSFVMLTLTIFVTSFIQNILLNILFMCGDNSQMV